MPGINLLWILQTILSLIFLFPLKDDRGLRRSFPAMTVGLVLLNVLAFLFVFYVLPSLVGDAEAWEALVMRLMTLPVDILQGEGLGALSMITGAFLHASWSHLIGNMFYLVFFGRKLEDVLGPVKFGLFYLVCVLVSSLVSVLGWAALPVTQGRIPSLGASGAIMGIIGAYLFLYSEQRIRTLVMVLVPIPFAINLPAWAFIVYTLAQDVLAGLLEQQLQAVGIAYSAVDMFAHMGGVLAGLMCLFLFLPAEMLYYRHRYDETR